MHILVRILAFVVAAVSAIGWNTAQIEAREAQIAYTLMVFRAQSLGTMGGGEASSWSTAATVLGIVTVLSLAVVVLPWNKWFHLN